MAAAIAQKAADDAKKAADEQKIRDDADAKKKDDELKALRAAAAKTAADAEEARKKAELLAKTRDDEAKKLLEGRGSLVIVTEPAGATIAIPNFVPLVSPATIKDLRLGNYAVTLTAPGYDPKDVNVDIKANVATDPGVIRLARQVGSLEITTDTPGISFEVRPAPPHVSVGAADVRQGKTPATLTDLPTGEYVVTFKREGWPDRTENVVIEHGKTAHVTPKYTGGSVTITSTPSGANVVHDGQTLGQTPLTLSGLQPGEITYSLELPAYISDTVRGQIEAEKTLPLNAVLMAADVIVPLNLLEEKPVAIKTVDPVLTYEMQRNGGSATISLTVDRDGTPKDLRVESATDPALGKVCMAAAAQWRFRPGMVKGEPVRTRVSLPFRM